MSGYVSPHYEGDKGKQYVAGRQDTLNHLGYRLQCKYFVPFLDKNDTVLDFGCGNGSIAVHLKPFVKSIYGLEVNEFARNFAVSQGLEVYRSLAEIPDKQRFDKIVSNHALEHIPNVFDTLCDLRRHLSQSGRLVVVLPIEDFRAKHNRVWTPDDPNRHFHTWTPLLFGNLLSEAGFLPLKLEVVTSAWSRKLFFLGEGKVQQIANVLFAVVKKRRQLFALAKPSTLDDSTVNR